MPGSPRPICLGSYKNDSSFGVPLDCPSRWFVTPTGFLEGESVSLSGINCVRYTLLTPTRSHRRSGVRAEADGRENDCFRKVPQRDYRSVILAIAADVFSESMRWKSCQLPL